MREVGIDDVLEVHRPPATRSEQAHRRWQTEALDDLSVEVRRRLVNVRQRLDQLEEAVQTGGLGDATLERLATLFARVDARLDAAENESNRCARVQTLPQSAPRGALILLAGDDTAVYVGLGPQKPLGKLLIGAV